VVVETVSLAVLAVGTIIASVAITGRLASGWIVLRAFGEQKAQDVRDIKVRVDPADDRVTETTEVLSVLALDPATLQ